MAAETSVNSNGWGGSAGRGTVGAVARLPSLALLLLAACPAPDPSRACEPLLVAGAGPTTVEALSTLLDEVRARLHPTLEAVTITLEPLVSRSDFFQATVDLDTVGAEPGERRYVVRFNPLLLAEPPSRAAVAAILAHELAHVVDYLGMDTEALVEFALWYGLTDDSSRYERATDEAALAAGCGPGLAEFRRWLYAHVDAATAERKRRDYYTPEEIAAWRLPDAGH